MAMYSIKESVWRGRMLLRGMDPMMTSASNRQLPEEQAFPDIYDVIAVNDE
jgi:hypothetical protein